MLQALWFLVMHCFIGWLVRNDRQLLVRFMSHSREKQREVKLTDLVPMVFGDGGLVNEGLVPG